MIPPVLVLVLSQEDPVKTDSLLMILPSPLLSLLLPKTIKISHNHSPHNLHSPILIQIQQGGVATKTSLINIIILICSIIIRNMTIICSLHIVMLIMVMTGSYSLTTRITMGYRHIMQCNFTIRRS